MKIGKIDMRLGQGDVFLTGNCWPRKARQRNHSGLHWCLAGKWSPSAAKTERPQVVTWNALIGYSSSFPGILCTISQIPLTPKRDELNQDTWKWHRIIIRMFSGCLLAHPPQHLGRQTYTSTVLFYHILNSTDLLLKFLTNGTLFVQKDFMALIKRQLQF